MKHDFQDDRSVKYSLMKCCVNCGKINLIRNQNEECEGSKTNDNSASALTYVEARVIAQNFKKKNKEIYDKMLEKFIFEVAEHALKKGDT